ncbi:MAG: hypothetical protein M3365_06000, partial [Gemmatimonadota bacterium]|nr:hypothetical protein [Gemmatimonadota bacterium]
MVLLLGVAGLAGTQALTPAGDNLILITLDGARIEEMFGGMDEGILRSTLPEKARVEDHLTFTRFTAGTPEE